MICVLQLPYIVQHLITELGKVVFGLSRSLKLYYVMQLQNTATTTKYSDKKQQTQSNGNTTQSNGNTKQQRNNSNGVHLYGCSGEREEFQECQAENKCTSKMSCRFGAEISTPEWRRENTPAGEQRCEESRSHYNRSRKRKEATQCMYSCRKKTKEKSSDRHPSNKKKVETR